MAEERVIGECDIPADGHIGMGRNVYGEGPSPYAAHAHPLGRSLGMVACCTGDDGCVIEGHLTRSGVDEVRHAELP